ncbi:MAG: ATP-binding protein, partial [Saprospiraceae bacterium]
QAGAEVQFASFGPDFRLHGDKMHLTGIVYNLLDNALKYSPLSPKITIHLSHESGNLILQVSDQGTGIAATQHEKIFDRFFRVPSGDVHNVKGHGLGLSYVAEVVGRHGGQIELTSALGEGASFTITLPQT